MSNPFMWWRVNEYGMAEAYPDSPQLCALLDKDPRGWFGNVEGTILHAGVLATAFKRKTEQTYDSAAWLRDGSMVPAGYVTTTEITAEPRSNK